MSYDALNPNAMAAGGRLFVLVDLYFGGQPLRLAATELDVVDAAAGVTYHYAAGCEDIDISEPFELLGDSAGGMSIPMDLHLPVDAAGLIARGEQLHGARVVVSMWVEGTDWSMRRPVLDGVVSDPHVEEMGEDGTPVSFSAETIEESAAVLMPSATSIVTGAAWANITSLSEEHLGAPYPTIIGTPGVVATDLQGDGRITGSVAAWADYRNELGADGVWYGLIAIIAGHHVSAERVIVANDGATAGVRMKVVNGFDLVGNPVAALLWFTSYTGGGYPTANGPWEYDATTTFDAQEVDTDAATVYGLGDNSLQGSLIADGNLDNTEQKQALIYIAWKDEIGGGGGTIWQGRTLRDAGDVITWAMSTSGRRVDWGRCAAAAPALAGYKIDAEIGPRVNRADWLKDVVLPLLPVCSVDGPDGWYYIVWRHDARPEDAVQHLDFDADPRIEIISGIETDGSRVANDFSLSYARSRRTGNTIAVARLGNFAYDSRHPRFIPSDLCKISQARRAHLGTAAVVSSDITTDAIYDDNTAHLINRWQAAARALPEERIRFRAPAQLVTRIERGSIVTVTRGGLHLDYCVGLVEEPTLTDGDMVEAPILLRRRPTADLRSAG